MATVAARTTPHLVLAYVSFAFDALLGFCFEDDELPI